MSRFSLALVVLVAMGPVLLVAQGPGPTSRRVQRLRSYEREPASAAFSFDPFIPMASQQEDWAALSSGQPNYWQVRIPYRPVFRSPYRPRHRRTRRLEASPFPFSPTDDFGDPVFEPADAPRL